VSRTDAGEWSISAADGGPWCDTVRTLKAAKAEIATYELGAGATVAAPAPKLTKTERFNAERARRIEAAGVNVETITGASVGLTSYGDDACALCDHAIKWLYVLHLTVSDSPVTAGDAAVARVVTFDPVGSTCIRTWADALPLGPGQESILAALKLAESEADKIKAQFREINSLERSGSITEEQATALIQFYSAPPTIRSSSFLSDVARKVIRYHGFTGRQWDSWSKSLRRDLSNVNAPRCGDCGAPTRARSGRYGDFYGCTKYGTGCRWTQNIRWERPKATSDSDMGKVEEHDAPAATPAPEEPVTAPADYDGDDLPF